MKKLIVYFILLTFIFLCIELDVGSETLYIPLVYKDWHNCPDETFTEVGSASTVQSAWGNVSGKVVVTGLHSLCVLNYSQSYGNITVDVWLVKWQDLYTPIVRLGTLECRPYLNEYIDLTNTIPKYMCEDSADMIVFYCVEWDYIIAGALFP